MEAYTSFAQVYDTFMDNVPYEDWSDRIRTILRQYGITGGLALDLGCGTGKMTELLAEAGFDMIGVDNSEDMLELAMEKRLVSGHDILYLLQDMQEFELYGTVGAIVSVCDSINYITDEEELLEVFRLANNYLDPHGIFLFDFNTEYKYREILGDNTFAEEREECSFIWENYYDPEEGINEYELTLFVREPSAPGLYRRYQEIHFQRGHTLERIKQLIQRSGMKYIRAFDDYTDRTPTSVSERILVVAQECGK